MRNNKWFSLVELIIVITIMAILIGIISPMFVKYIAKSKRVVDINNAESFIEGARVVLTEHELDTRYDGVHYSASVAWNKNSHINIDNPSNLLDYFGAELGQLPLSKAHPDYFWILEYDQNATPTKLSIADGLGLNSKRYELWPDSSAYLAGD